MAKPDIHNEWFQKLVKTKCPCGQKKTEVFAWGEYVNGRWTTVAHFCQACFVRTVQNRLINHARACGCAFEIKARSGNGPLPEWIKMPEVCRAA